MRPRKNSRRTSSSHSSTRCARCRCCGCQARVASRTRASGSCTQSVGCTRRCRRWAASQPGRLVRVARRRPAAERARVGNAPRLGRTTCAPGAGAGHPGGGAGDAGGAVQVRLGWLACAGGLASYSTKGGVVRNFLTPARRLLASRRRRRALAVGLVGRRGAGLTAARRRSATSRSSASWRLRSWVR